MKNAGRHQHRPEVEVTDGLLVSQPLAPSTPSSGMYYLVRRFGLRATRRGLRSVRGQPQTTTHNDDRRTTRWSVVFVGHVHMAGGTVIYLGAEYYGSSTLLWWTRSLVAWWWFRGQLCRRLSRRDCYMVEGVFPILIGWKPRHSVRTTTPTSVTPPPRWYQRCYPYEQLRFRASWGEGFRAPDLSVPMVQLTSAEGATDFWGSAAISLPVSPVRYLYRFQPRPGCRG